MIPDKIYIPNNIDFVSAAILQNKKPEDIEYIRKDALLKWVKEKFESYANICTRTGNDVDFGCMNAFSMIINKIESL